MNNKTIFITGINGQDGCYLAKNALDNGFEVIGLQRPVPNYRTDQVVYRLKEQGINCRVVDIRWLQPLPIDALIKDIGPRKNILIVDECRQNSGIANELAASLWEALDNVKIRRVQAKNTYIPLGAAANLVLVQEEDIEHHAKVLLEST